MNTQTVGYKAKAFEPRNLVFFFLMAFGLTWFGAALLILGIVKLPSEGGLSLGSVATLVFLIVPACGPTISAFVMTAVTEGRPGVKALWGRFWNRNLGLKWLLVALLCLPVLRLAANLVDRTLDGVAYPILDLPNPPWMIIASFVMAFISNGLTEEFGWRGYALPRFQARWNALFSSIVLGAILASWHIPSFFIPGTPLSQQNFWEWAPWVILCSILMTWIFNNTKGSVLSAALFHAMLNTGIIQLFSLWHYYGVLLLAVILIVIIFGAKDFVRQRPKVVPYGLESEIVAEPLPEPPVG